MYFRLRIVDGSVYFSWFNNPEPLRGEGVQIRNSPLYHGVDMSWHVLPPEGYRRQCILFLVQLNPEPLGG